MDAHVIYPRSSCEQLRKHACAVPVCVAKLRNIHRAALSKWVWLVGLWLASSLVCWLVGWLVCGCVWLVVWLVARPTSKGIYPDDCMPQRLVSLVSPIMYKSSRLHPQRVCLIRAKSTVQLHYSLHMAVLRLPSTTA